MTLFPTFTLQTNPNVTDADGNSVNRSAFDVRRAYINITGNISHLIAFPHHARHHAAERVAHASRLAAPCPNDSLVFRIKYAYAQFNLDDWMTRGSWVRLGIQQTPWVDFEEGIYRYRFQGTVFAERIPLPTAMTSADAGVSFHYNFPSNYGDVHVGVYNGENYQRVELNDQKALRIPRHGPAVRRRASRCCAACARISSTTTTTTPATTSASALMGNVTFEHKYVNAGFDYLDAKDQTLRDRRRRLEPAATRSGRRRDCRSPTARRGKRCCATITGRPTPRHARAGLDVTGSGRHRSATRSRTARSSACRTGSRTRAT